MELAFPADVAPQFSSWMQFLETSGGWEDWMRQLDKDLGPVKNAEDSLLEATQLATVYQRVHGLLSAAMLHQPQSLAACLYQTDVPEQWFHNQPFSADLLAKAVLWRTLQKVVFRKQFTHPA